MRNFVLGDGLGWRRRREGEGMGQSTTPRSPTLYLVTFKTRTGVHTGGRSPWTNVMTPLPPLNCPPTAIELPLYPAW